MTRAVRLNERFKTIQRTLEELYGRERAFGAATAAWLMAVQYMHKQALLRVDRDAMQALDVEWKVSKSIAVLEGEMEAILQSFHAELCEHLGVDQAEAWRHARAFKQVIDDVCHQGG